MSAGGVGEGGDGDGGGGEGGGGEEHGFPNVALEVPVTSDVTKVSKLGALPSETAHFHSDGNSPPDTSPVYLPHARFNGPV